MAFAVAEATAPVNDARKAAMLEFLGISEEQCEWVGSESTWKRREPGTAEARLELLLNNQLSGAANLHVVEVIDRCLRMVLREHDEGLPEGSSRRWIGLASGAT